MTAVTFHTRSAVPEAPTERKAGFWARRSNEVKQ